jgi:hypothetical protein
MEIPRTMNRNGMLAVLLCSSLFAPLAAQDQEAMRQGLISLEFAGGSLNQFAASLRKAGTNVNIVMPELASEVPVPALRLTQTTVESALRAVGQMTTQAFRIDVEVMRRSPLESPVYSVAVMDLRPPEQKAPPQREIAVFSLQELTRTMPGDPDDEGLSISADTILTAIDAGLDLGETSRRDKVGIRYHEDSGLLFIRGTREEIRLVEAALQHLRNDLERRRISARARARESRPPAGARDKGNVRVR